MTMNKKYDSYDTWKVGSSLFDSTANVMLQVNARKVYDEANVVAGILTNKLFTGILLGEATLQVATDLYDLE